MSAEALTPREREVVVLVCEDLTNDQIATRMGISYKTVEQHRGRAMQKAGVHSAVGLLRWALRRGIVSL